MCTIAPTALTRCIRPEPSQEAIVLALRQSFYLPVDDLLFITKQYTNPAVSRAGIVRLLRPEGMSRLTDLIATAEVEKVTPKQSFKDYEPGFIHIDIKYLPRMPDENSRRYLFAAVDRATRCLNTHLRRHDQDKQRRFPTSAQTGLVHQNQQDPDAALSKLKYSPSHC